MDPAAAALLGRPYPRSRSRATQKKPRAQAATDVTPLPAGGVHIGACDLKAFESDLGSNVHSGYVSGIDKGHDTGVVDLGTKQPDG